MQLARGGRDIRLWDIDADNMKKVVVDRANERYLPGVSFPENLHPEPDLVACLDRVRDILIVVPSHGLRETLKTIKPTAWPLSNGVAPSRLRELCLSRMQERQ